VRAITIPEYGGPEVLVLADVDEPEPGPDEILVRVHHSAVNRADTLQRRGGYPDPRRRAVEIPGLEYAGTVESVGDRVTSWRAGDRVMGIESGACYAEYVVTHERQALRIPATVAMEDAAAIPEVFLTGWDALVAQGGLTSGRWALVHAGGSGVGTAAIQIAGAIGARIVVTCSQRKMEACSALGADEVLERSPADWLSALQAAHPDGVDVVLDVVGGDEADRNLRAVRTRGTVVQVGLMGGGSTTVNLGVLLTKRVTWIGTTLRARPLEEKLAVCRRFADEILPRFDDGSLRPVIHARYELADAADAHREMEADANVGKILLDIAT
jgi:putative PIG3 family NAD(P)H quinone oxidoreductase